MDCSGGGARCSPRPPPGAGPGGRRAGGDLADLGMGPGWVASSGGQMERFTFLDVSAKQMPGASVSAGARRLLEEGEGRHSFLSRPVWVIGLR